jgi:hypothetical protein
VKWFWYKYLDVQKVEKLLLGHRRIVPRPELSKLLLEEALFILLR